MTNRNGSFEYEIEDGKIMFDSYDKGRISFNNENEFEVYALYGIFRLIPITFLIVQQHTGALTVPTA